MARNRNARVELHKFAETAFSFLLSSIDFLPLIHFVTELFAFSIAEDI